MVKKNLCSYYKRRFETSSKEVILVYNSDFLSLFYFILFVIFFYI
jgi:hypothetical protein